MHKLRLGVIGCGEIAKYMFLFAGLNRNVKIVGCADRNIDKARKYASYFKGAAAYDDYREMLQNLHLDAVYIALPHYLHYPVMREIIQSGIHVFCEKPVVSDYDEALDIVDMAGKCQIKVGVNYQYRYNNACYRMARAAQNGELGELYYGICNIPWCRSEDYFTKSTWHSLRERSGGGTLMTHGSHGLDILLWSFGSRPEQAAGFCANRKFTSIEVEDLCMGIVELESGALLQLSSSVAATDEQPVSITIYGSKGTAVCECGDITSRLEFLSIKVPKYKVGIPGGHPLGRSLEAFRRWVLYDMPYHNSIEDALPVLSTVLAIYENAQGDNKTPVRIK